MALSIEEKDKILIQALKIANDEGWQDDLIARATAAARMKPAASVQAFPGGLIDLLDHMADWGIRQMEQKIQKKQLIRMKIRERVGLCVQTWLENLSPYKSAMQNLIALSWQPRYGWLSIRHTARLADAIWYECGDTATDFNYYSKRTLLSGVIVSTTLYWLKNDDEAAWQFLSNRIDNVLVFGKRMGEWKSASQSLFKTARFIKSRAR